MYSPFTIFVFGVHVGTIFQSKFVRLTFDVIKMLGKDCVRHITAGGFNDILEVRSYETGKLYSL